MLIEFHFNNGKKLAIDLSCHQMEENESGFMIFRSPEDPHEIWVQLSEVAWFAVHPSREEYRDPFKYPPPHRRLDPRNIQPSL